jgi:predicted Zn-dependent protease
MGLRMTVVAALGMGVLAAPCGGLSPSAVSTGLDVATRLGGAAVNASEQCKKLDVEPSVKEEYALGGALAINWVQRGSGLMKDEALHRYVNIVGKNLAAQSPRPTLEWTFGVLNDDKQFNAISAPGGYVFVTRRLLRELDNEGQLAGVLAHEIAHVALKHAIHQYNATKVKTCVGVMLGEVFLPPGAAAALSAGRDGDGTLNLDDNPGLLGNLAEGTINIFDDGNSEEQELAADRMAVQLMLSAGYDADDFRRLIAKTTEDTTFVDHPKKSKRVKELVTYLDTLKPREDEFTELTTGGRHSPPLKPEFTAAIRPNVARDVK